MSEALHFAEHTLQEVALLWMATIYIIRIWWMSRFTAGKERQAPTGRGSATPTASIAYSLANIAMPWGMESTRKRWGYYVQFVLFHLGAVGAIGLSFIIPYAPQWLESPAMVMIIRALLVGGFLVGIMRIYHRLSDKYMRAISTPDDYFSLILLTIFFLFAFLAAPNDLSKGEGVMMTYFYLTAFFLFYVPFSKISHYIYYPFARYYLGKTMGRRGVFPIVHSKPAS